MLSYNIKTILKTLNKLNGMIQLHGILLQWNFIIHPPQDKINTNFVVNSL